MVKWCLGVVDPFESFEWRTLLTTREKVLSIREMNLISGTLEITKIICCGLARSMVLRLSIRSNRTNGEHHLRPEKKSCRSEK